MRPTKAIDESGPKMKDPAILKCLPFKTFKSAPHFDNLWSCGGMHISKDILGNDGAGECIFHHGCVSVSSFQKWEMMFPPWMVSFFPRMFSKMVGAVDVLGLFKLHWTIENREPAGDRILYFIHCIMICLGWNNCCQTNPKEHIVDHKWSYDEIIQINCTVTVKIVKNDQTYLFITSFVYNLTSQILYIPWTPMVFGNFLATKKHRPLIHDDPWLSRLHQLRRTDRGRCPAKSWEPSGWRIHPGRRGETNGGNGCHNFKKPSKWKTNQKISGLEHLRLKPWVVPIKKWGLLEITTNSPKNGIS